MMLACLILPPPRQDELAQLARAAAQGDQSAIGALLRAVTPAMVGVIRTMVPKADLEDIMQEALTGLVRALPGFRYECSVKHFCCRVAVQTATVAWRAQRRRRDAYERAQLEPVDEHVVSPAENVASARRQALMQSLLKELPEEQAETLALRVVLGYSLEEVAEATGAPVNTVRSRMRLAREALKLRIESDPGLTALAHSGEA